MTPNDLESLLAFSLYGNSVQQWLIAVAAAVATFFVLRFLKGVITRRFKKLADKTSNKLDDFVVELFASVHSALLAVVAIYIAVTLLTLPDTYAVILTKVLLLGLLLQAALWGTALVNFVLQQYLASKENEEERNATLTMTGPMRFLGIMVVWTLILLLALDNLGINITALVTGLGIGGIAIALAVQNILGDLLASLSIILDKPFQVGDFIIIDDLMGTVEHIGLKTTRMRSLSGEQLVFSNSDLLKSRIRNYKRMQERRIVFGFGVLYQTTYEQLKAIPEMVKSIIDATDFTRFDRAHFAKYGDSSLDFEVVYYTTSPDYNIYMNMQQEINLELFRCFQESGIGFAYPTQTIFIEKSEE